MKRRQQGQQKQERIGDAFDGANKLNERPWSSLRDLIMPAGVILAGFPERGRNEARARTRTRTWKLTRARTRARDAHTHMRSAAPDAPAPARRPEAVIRTWLARSCNVREHSLESNARVSTRGFALHISRSSSSFFRALPRLVLSDSTTFNDMSVRCSDKSRCKL